MEIAGNQFKKLDDSVGELEKTNRFNVCWDAGGDARAAHLEESLPVREASFPSLHLQHDLRDVPDPGEEALHVCDG